MALDRRFVRARIVETAANVWVVEVVFSYYGMYEFTETKVLSSMNLAIQHLLKVRCGDRLVITNVAKTNIDI
jgi:hypothetical protein